MTAKVAAAAEEPAEQIEWIVVLTSASLLALLETFVSVLVVYFAGFGVNQGFVGLGYFDKLLFGSIIAAN